jgi:amino acid transporter
VAAAAMSTVLGNISRKMVAVTILISMFSAANAIMLTSPRVCYAMARDGLFFKRLSDVRPRFGTPAFAVIAATVWAAALAVTGTFQQLLTYVVFVGWISMRLPLQVYSFIAGDCPMQKDPTVCPDIRSRRWHLLWLPWPSL